MGKSVVLAEKPSVAKDLARVLACNKKGNGFFEGDSYIVTWALGHLVTLADPEAYGDTYKSWRLDDLPILPKKLKLVVIRQTSKQFYTVKTQLARKDVDTVIIATDAGREGELVARWILELAGVNKPIQRLWISSVTDKAIREGFRSLKPGKAYGPLYASAVARAESDWMVGINATRALTAKYNAQLSCGRVQTPTLAMIAKREQEIQDFIPTAFYGITATTTSNLVFTYRDTRTKDTRIHSKEACERILVEMRNKPAEVVSVDTSKKKQYAPQLFDLTELQREAHRLFGYSAKETLSILQRLYEQHKVLTYPRTDSRYLSSDLVDTLPDRIRACSVGPYTAYASKLLKQPIHTNRSIVDDQKVSDHHAIIPTEESVYLGTLQDKERKIYDLVVKRFLSVFYPPFEYEQTVVQVTIANHELVAKGNVVKAVGWKEVYGDQTVEDTLNDENGSTQKHLPVIQVGERFESLKLALTTGQTKPPERFNEGTLLSAMEHPARYMETDSQELIRTIGETGGLGTVATRADIIEKLFHSFLIEKKGKDLYITSKGRQLLELVPDELRSPILTAKWEQQLASISKGTLSKAVFLDEMRQYAGTVVNQIKFSDKTFRHDNLSSSRCPECGKRMLEVNGKKGKLLVCQDRECGQKKHISRNTNARCPNCHKKLTLHGEGEGQIFVCKCGYREKLSAFETRKQSTKSQNVSKKDVSNYLRKQKKENEEPVNSALADALSKLKFD